MTDFRIDPHFQRHTTRVRLHDGRLGTRKRAPIDSLWTIEVDDGEVLYCSVLRAEPVAEELGEAP